MDRETRDMLLDTADRFFTERCGKDIVNSVEKGVWPADLWKEIEEMGLPLIAVAEDRGGAGGTLADMLAVLRLAGSHAVPVPLAETAECVDCVFCDSCRGAPVGLRIRGKRQFPFDLRGEP